MDKACETCSQEGREGALPGKDSKDTTSVWSGGTGAPSVQLEALLARAVVNAQQLSGIVGDTIKKKPRAIDLLLYLLACPFAHFIWTHHHGMGNL